jgi:hypothetical protein
MAAFQMAEVQACAQQVTDRKSVLRYARGLSGARWRQPDPSILNVRIPVNPE